MHLLRVVTVAVALLATATAVCSAAQGARPGHRASRPSRTATAAPGPDLYAGYSYTHAGAAGLHGWALAGTYPHREGSWRGVLELTGHYGTYALADLSQTALFGGVRRTFEWRGVQPFAEGLVGLARTTISAGAVSGSDTDWGVALGAGADVAVNERWAVRGLAQLRLLRGEGTLDDDVRFSAGVVYRLGR